MNYKGVKNDTDKGVKNDTNKGVKNDTNKDVKGCTGDQLMEKIKITSIKNDYFDEISYELDYPIKHALHCLENAYIKNDKSMVNDLLILIISMISNDPKILDNEKNCANGLKMLKEIQELNSNENLDILVMWFERKYPIDKIRIFPLDEEEKIVMEKNAIAKDEFMAARNKWAEENPEKIAEQKLSKLKVHSFKSNDIVGARDKEGKWWLSRVLCVINDPNFPLPWYYIHFHGWGHIQNEWIGSKYRVRKFMARRDNLKY